MNRFLPFFFLLAEIAHAQVSPRDSLLQVIRASDRDTAAVNAYYAYGELMENESPDSSLLVYTKARNLAREIGFTKGELAYAGYMLPLLNNRGEYRAALTVAAENLELCRQKGSMRDLAAAYLNLGSEWHYLSDFQLAAENYLASKKYAEQLQDIALLRKSNNNLASVFLSLEQFEKGRKYAETGLKYALLQGNDAAVSSSMYNLATADVYLQRYDTALALFDRIEKIAGKLNDDVIYLDAWIGKAGAYDGAGNKPKALYYFEKVITFSREKQFPEYEMYAFMGLADHYLKYRDFASARIVIAQGIAIARALETKYELKDLLLKASRLEELTGNHQPALAFYKEATALDGEITGEKHRIAIANNEAKYEFEKKESEIATLKAGKELDRYRIRQQRTINIALAACTALLLLVFLLIFRNSKQKQALHKQRIAELETEKKLTATKAIMKGEEQERSRLAKDLHDGLGGMLSGIKYALHHMKDTLIMTEENAMAFEHSLRMLDSSIAEMRRVAHNMMPEALLKFGLDASLRDYCNQVAVSGVITISYQYIGRSDRHFEQLLSITIYRVAQELLNNSIRHAAAKNAIVQLAAEENQVTLTVEDDGKGFDVDALETATGIGWKNIRSRLVYHNGKLDIRSAPGQGTSVHIEFAL